MVTRALFRAIPDSFTRAISRETPTEPIDVAKARAQHAAYRAAFGDARQVLVDADEACPDCVFVEDTAVVVGTKALITRPGAPSRQREPSAVAAALAPYLDLVTMEPPATLDGGDVMFANDRCYVGKSTRTNEAGIEMLGRLVGRERLVVVDLPPSVLHLKCVVSPLEGDQLALADESLSPDVFPGFEIVRIPVAETYAANIVALGGRLIVAEGYPRTLEALDRAGYDGGDLCEVPVSEVQKADGSLTCQSIRWS
ncbi:MAG: hypothetical protein JNL83_06850 [Myxococcales bacterium]|nr:hypothetical protein [Myxococcales bacterium]